MLALDMADFWLFGKWIPGGYSPSPTPSTPGDVMQDIFGQTLAVGNKVKLVGTIIALDPMNAHFQDVTFVPDYPQSVAVQNDVGLFPQDQLIKSIKCHPLQLIKVGSSL